MRLVSIEQLQPGDRLARDVFLSDSSIPLLRAGVRISAAYVDGLRRGDIQAVYVDDQLSAGIEPLEAIAESTQRAAREGLREAFAQAASSEGAIPAVSPQQISALQGVAAQIAADVADCGDAAVALNDLASVDGYTLQHSIDVTALGLLLAHRLFERNGWIDYSGARRYDGIQKRLVSLGTGLLLHDVGKLAIPTEILAKPGPLTDEEWVTMREHPDAGYKMLGGTNLLPALTKDVVLHHHERWDGSGYPGGLAGTKISQFSRIAAVADVFDAVTANRAYKGAAPAHEGVAVVSAASATLFDPEIVDIFERTVAPYPPGLAVVLSDGARGIVSECPVWAVARPRVRVVADASGRGVPPTEVDLAYNPGLEIVAVGTEVELPLAAAAA